MLSENQSSVINKLRSAKYHLSISDFETVWHHFERKGSGKIKVEELSDWARRTISVVNVESISPYREVLCEILAQKEEVYINILDVIPLLPLPGDILARHYIVPETTPCVLFMELWREFNTDGSGYLDSSEVKVLFRRLLEQEYRGMETERGIKHRQFDITEVELDRFVNRIFVQGDTNKDEKIQMEELARLLNVEENFLEICPRLLQQKKLSEIFDHYDQDNSGELEGPEFLALVRDVLRIDKRPLSRMRRQKSDVNVEELELAGTMIMGLVDENNDGKLDKKQINQILEPTKKHKLIKDQTQFLKLQEIFKNEACTSKSLGT